ncbi:hypothetical protein cypCar_00037010 [Cyprinus carpio]|nr:hypothetical protein cypCar_00037010 [Cyprinus carpio]
MFKARRREEHVVNGCIMPKPAQLRVILADHDVRKVLLPSGIPETVDDLHSVIRDTFYIARDFSLHYKDVDFDEFFTLYSTTDLKDKDTIKKMAKTFSLHREEIVKELPAISDCMKRWPALFTEAQDNTVERRREIAIRCLIVYLGEKEEDLFKQYRDVEELDADLAMQVMKIAIIGDGRATIVVEGTKILQGIDVARSCALLMGVIYALNLSYPKQLKFTFEAFQKLCLELDGQKASSKCLLLLDISPGVSKEFEQSDIDERRDDDVSAAKVN